MIRRTFLTGLLTVGLGLATAFSHADSTPFPPQLTEVKAEFAKPFAKYQVKGTFVMLDGQTGRYSVYNLERASERKMPASTFKLFNSLVALDTGALKDDREVIAWDGVERDFTSWNRDMNIRDAIRVSNVPFYQELARRIGREKMQAALNQVGYGNKMIGREIDQFWLDNTLQISAKEQVDFVMRLARGKLPFSARAIDMVQQISVLERTPNYVLHGKTGWGGRATTPGVGWWTGYLERGDKLYAFAMNMDMQKLEDAPLRLKIAKQIMLQQGLIEE